MFDFGGRTLVLTGANGGIARAIARTFHALGANLLLADIDEKGLAAFAREFDVGGKRVAVVRQDARSRADAERVAAQCRERFAGADYLVTGAGLYRDKVIAEMTEAQWSETISVNLDGVFHTCRAMIPLLREGGAIVNIASMAGHRGSFRHAHYAAAKGGVLSFTRSLALELAPRIRANAVSPGLIDTPMIESLFTPNSDRLIESTPLKRLGRPVEVATVVAFLCSDLASFVTGETIHINGGLYIAG